MSFRIRTSLCAHHQSNAHASHTKNLSDDYSNSATHHQPARVRNLAQIAIHNSELRTTPRHWNGHKMPRFACLTPFHQ